MPHVGYSRAQPLIVGDRVVFGTGDGRLIARDRATGREVWSAIVSPRQAVEGTKLVLRQGVIAAAAVHHTVGVDAETGALRWRYDSPIDTVNGGTVPGSLVLNHIDADESTVYIPAWGATVSAVDMRTGATRWVWRPGRAATDTGAAGVFRSGAQGVRVSGDTVFASVWHFLNPLGGRSEIWLVALDSRTGGELWRVTLPGITMAVGVRAQPAIWRNLVIQSVSAGNLFAIDRTTRQIVWQASVDPPDEYGFYASNISSPAVAGDTVYHDGSNGYFYARRASDGARLWRVKYEGQFGDDFLITPRRILVGNGGYLFVFDRQTGRRIVKLARPHHYTGFFASTAAFANGRIFVGVDNAFWSFDEP